MKSSCQWIARLVFVLVLGIWGSGCSSPSGHLYLDHPDVFTWERLVNRRLAGLQWREVEMKRPVSSTLQGGRDQRSFSGLSVQLEAQFDPMSALGAKSAVM